MTAVIVSALNARIRHLQMPSHMEALPISDTGFPVPWFVAWLEDGRAVRRGTGKPDFRIMHPGAGGEAHRRSLCWICGRARGQFGAFTIGPMCAVNRISSEPPSHSQCAEYAVKACPFLSQPRMVRNDKGLPEGHGEVEGMLKRNAGVALIWVTKSYTLHRVTNGVLFQIGDPERVSWWCQGRPATRAEVLESIEGGMPALREQAAKQGMQAQLPRLLRRAMPMVPAA